MTKTRDRNGGVETHYVTRLRKGKTYEEIYGEEGAHRMRAKHRSTTAVKRVNPLTASKSLEILAALHWKPRHIRGLIKEVGGSATTILERVDELKRHGFVKIRRYNTWPYKHVVDLTFSGRELSRIYLSTGRKMSKKKVEV